MAKLERHIKVGSHKGWDIYFDTSDEKFHAGSLYRWGKDLFGTIKLEQK